MPQSLADLNREHAIAGVLHFEDAAADYPVAHISNPQGRARIALHGAHVLSYQPADMQEVLWLSDSARFQPDKAIRGGVPICWPWFGPDPSGLGRPAHGFARNRFWQLASAEHDPQRGTQLRFSLPQSDEVRALWPQPFDLQLAVGIGARLDISLRMKNRGDTPMRCSGALHSYFAVSDIDRIRISGLEQRSYLDQLDAHAHRVQQGPISIDQEVDRIYIGTEDTVRIEDPGHDRCIRIAKRGSRSTVVWNPWVEKSAGMDDFHAEGHRQMVCVETSNAASDEVLLAPGQQHELACVISAQRLGR